MEIMWSVFIWVYMLLGFRTYTQVVHHVSLCFEYRGVGGDETLALKHSPLIKKLSDYIIVLGAVLMLCSFVYTHKFIHRSGTWVCYPLLMSLCLFMRLHIVVHVHLMPEWNMLHAHYLEYCRKPHILIKTIGWITTSTSCCIILPT